MKTRAIRVSQVGGPEVLEEAETALLPPGEGQVRILQTVIGVNFIDVYHRTGLYKLDLPAVIGSEGAGVVEELGPGVSGLEVGTRVAYAALVGAYAERRNAPVAKLVKLPDAIDERTAAAIMLKGMTARYLLRSTHVVTPGETVVIHAAAGGTGQLLVQWANHLGAKVIAVVGSEKKAEIVRGLGAARAVVSTSEDFVAVTLEETSGRGADVVYDSVGRDTFTRSFEAIKMRGMVVSFGQASGPVPPFDLSLLAKKCAFLTRPSLFAYVAERSDLDATARDLFEVIEKGVVKAEIGRVLPLSDAREAHRALEARETTGATLLIP